MNVFTWDWKITFCPIRSLVVVACTNCYPRDKLLYVNPVLAVTHGCSWSSNSQLCSYLSGFNKQTHFICTIWTTVSFGFKEFILVGGELHFILTICWSFFSLVPISTYFHIIMSYFRGAKLYFVNEMMIILFYALHIKFVYQRSLLILWEGLLFSI